MALFELGQLVATPGVLNTLGDNAVPIIIGLVRRHLTGDFGEVDAEDRKENELSIREGFRIVSAYTVEKQKIWIITDAVGDDGHRASSCVLLPSEY